MQATQQPNNGDCPLTPGHIEYDAMITCSPTCSDDVFNDDAFEDQIIEDDVFDDEVLNDDEFIDDDVLDDEVLNDDVVNEEDEMETGSDPRRGKSPFS